MASVAAPYGLRPVGLLSGQYYAGSFRKIRIKSGYATDIFFGDVVQLTDDTGPNYINKDTGTATATPVGVFLGCEYTDQGSGQRTFRQYWPASTVAADAYAFVADDPNLLFQVAAVSGTTVINGVAETVIGQNTSLVQNAGSTVTGNSAVAVSSTTATTNTLPLRIVDVVRGSEDSSGNFTEIIVKWNAGMHQYDTATGV